MSRDPELTAARRVVTVTECREHDDGDRWVSWMSLDAFADRKAAQSRHGGVEEHDGKWSARALRFVERCECSLTITCELWLHTPSGKPSLEQVPRQGIVVDHQHWELLQSLPGADRLRHRWLMRKPEAQRDVKGAPRSWDAFNP